ncbi:MAG: hypothetical protein IJN54_05685 [Lachnospiraceae bacterium]|nr:hypothetical protein [Lachnospiraceae bacterium]
MIPALNMHLEDVRVVLKNEINDITVCRDVKENGQKFYTMISIKDDMYRKYITEQMSVGNMFSHCKDFIGSFSMGKELKLVFRYEVENLIGNVGSIYLYDFARCRQAAIQLVSVIAEKGMSGQICKLLLNPRNINIDRECSVTLNYFLDFQEYDLNLGQFNDMDCIAETVFSILERPWKEKFQGEVQNYPDELRLFWMKIQNHSFLSYGQIVSQLRGMPNKPIAKQGVIWKIRKVLRNIRTVLFKNPLRIVLTVLVAVTIVYAAWQISMRIKVQRAYQKNVSYSAMEYIGTVYLGDEE